MRQKRGTRTQEVAAPTAAGSGWSPGLTSAGYLTRVFHFYPAGETRSACLGRFRKSRAPKPKDQLRDGVEYHKGCEDWVAQHPKGGKRYSA